MAMISTDLIDPNLHPEILDVLPDESGGVERRMQRLAAWMTLPVIAPTSRPSAPDMGLGDVEYWMEHVDAEAGDLEAPAPIVWRVSSQGDLAACIDEVAARGERTARRFRLRDKLVTEIDQGALVYAAAHAPGEPSVGLLFARRSLSLFGGTAPADDTLSYSLECDLAYVAPRHRHKCLGAYMATALVLQAREDLEHLQRTLSERAWKGTFYPRVSGDAVTKGGGRLLSSISHGLGSASETVMWSEHGELPFKVEDVREDWGF